MGSRSSATDLHPAWVRWLLPSMADVLFLALAALLSCTTLSVRLLGDAGIGWHIRAGQIVLGTHAIPRIDPFSTQAGQPWFAWEWLYDVLVGWFESAAGLNGVVLFTAVIIAAVFSWTFRWLVRRGTNLLLALVLVLLATSASMIHFLARPHVVSWFFTISWFWILDSFEKTSDARSTRLVWSLPLLMLIWVNVHGGFLAGFVLLGVYWFSSSWQCLFLKDDRLDDALRKIQARRRARALTWIGLLSGAATFANPYGFKLHIHIYRYLSNRFLMDHIDEFLSPNFHYVAQKCFAVLLLLTLIALAVKRSRANVSHVLIVLFAVYSGLYASRNIPVSSLLLILVMGPWLSDWMKSLAEKRPNVFPLELGSTLFLERMEAIEFNLRGHLWPILAIAVLCWAGAHEGKVDDRTLMDAHFSEKRFPVAAVNYLKNQNIRGSLSGPDYWGGYLIYRLYPRAKVVVDDRHDFYGEDFMRSYLKMVRVEPGWKDFLHAHPASCVLAPEGSALANILKESAGWHSIYNDNVAVVFVRPENNLDAPPMLQNPSH